MEGVTDTLLRNSLCVVRAPREADASSLARHANDRDIWINLRNAFPHPYTLEDAQWWIDNVSRQKSRVSFVIDVNGEACGGIGLKLGEDIESGTAEVGYWLGKEHWGRGVMSAALITLCQYAFDSLGLIRLFAVPIVWNSASFRVLEKAGFQREGTLRKACTKDGTVADMAMYALVR
jgi:ribosomal-protein-alanine N-acetyltransferase